MPDVALEPLRDRLRELGPVVVAFSGGADSAFLAWVAHDTLGSTARCAVTAVSPSLPAAERDDCERARGRDGGCAGSRSRPTSSTTPTTRATTATAATGARTR